MKYISIIFLFILSIYPFSYAKFNWNKENKLGAVGMALLATLSIIVPSIVLFFR